MTRFPFPFPIKVWQGKITKYIPIWEDSQYPLVWTSLSKIVVFIFPNNSCSYPLLLLIELIFCVPKILENKTKWSNRCDFEIHLILCFYWVNFFFKIFLWTLFLLSRFLWSLYPNALRSRPDQMVIISFPSALMATVSISLTMTLWQSRLKQRKLWPSGQVLTSRQLDMKLIWLSWEETKPTRNCWRRNKLERIKNNILSLWFIHMINDHFCL